MVLRAIVAYAGVILFGSMGAGDAMGQEIRYNGSVQYASGSYYFTQRTGSFYLNNGLTIAGDNISFSFDVPLITQNTPWLSYSSTGIGLLPTGGPRSGQVSKGKGQGAGNGKGKRNIDLGSADTLNYTKTSFSDPSLMVNATVFTSERGRTIISSSVGVKFPIANPNAGFGTGEWDIGAGLSWSQRFSEQWIVIISGMYWKLGDMEELNFNDMVSYSTGLGRSFGNAKLMAIGNFFGSTEIIDGVDPPMSVGAGLSYRPSTKLNFNTNVLMGLSESASDLSFGLGWSVTL
jgi:hypothetical protein